MSSAINSASEGGKSLRPISVARDILLQRSLRFHHGANGGSGGFRRPLDQAGGRGNRRPFGVEARLGARPRPPLGDHGGGPPADRPPRAPPLPPQARALSPPPP